MFVAGVINNKNDSVFPKCISSLLSGSSIKYSMVELCKFFDNREKNISVYLKELSQNAFELAVLYINEDCEQYLNNINIEFDMLFYNSDDKDSDILRENLNFYYKISNLLNHSGTMVINSDFINPSELFGGRELYLVTYGFNSKASITASSVGDNLSDDFFLCSLQRTVLDINKRLLEPQEYKLKRVNPEVTDYQMLALAVFGGLMGLELC